MRIEPYGAAGWLVSDLDDPHHWASALGEARIHGVERTQLGTDSVLVCCAAERAEAVRERLSRVQAGPGRRFHDQVVEVHFDAAGLSWVGAALELDTDAVRFRLCAMTMHVACYGPSPASPLMCGLDETWDAVSPRAHPTRTAPGDVLMSGRWCRIQRTPEHTRWVKVATTDAAQWYLTHEPRPSLPPGTRIRLREGPTR